MIRVLDSYMGLLENMECSFRGNVREIQREMDELQVRRQCAEDKVRRIQDLIKTQPALIPSVEYNGKMMRARARADLASVRITNLKQQRSEAQSDVNMVLRMIADVSNMYNQELENLANSTLHGTGSPQNPPSTNSNEPPTVPSPSHTSSEQQK